MSKLEFITPYFEKWEYDVQRAELLLKNDEYSLEGLIVVICYIGALGSLRYQGVEDWKSYKDIICNYSDKSEIFENIDLLLFSQFKKSKLANEKIYSKLENYDLILEIITNEYGDELKIKYGDDSCRYAKKEDISTLIKSLKTSWYNESNFMQYIQLFSNNHILYKYARCEAVHNADFPLLNSSYNLGTGKTTYKDNHQVDRELILNSVKNIVANLKKECISRTAWPWEL